MICIQSYLFKLTILYNRYCVSIVDHTVEQRWKVHSKWNLSLSLLISLHSLCQ